MLAPLSNAYASEFSSNAINLFQEELDPLAEIV